ncbi:xyloglucan galactosyltransferase XLT2-like [Typha latifolia]|uniref:xyloglucan galactosyltransferase XLT2-like n=1 Tax=Typha latifolia TaxID=4733 RepID=UPI003C2D4AE8
MVPRLDPPGYEEAEAMLLKHTKNSSSSSTFAVHLHLHLSPLYRGALVLLIVSLQLILLLSTLYFPSGRLYQFYPRSSSVSSCELGMVYVYDLPPLFNRDLLAACDALNPWSSFCPALSNSGFGHSADVAGVVPASLLPSWFSTDQFAAEVIFHSRLLSHRCRTPEPYAAAAFYIPFYAGLAVGRHLWSPNATSTDLDKEFGLLLHWLEKQAAYQRSNGGWDHFITLGRITWDFRRSREGDWGSSFLYMPGMENVTRLVIERNPWDDKDVGIPYPTRFHPRSKEEVQFWQQFVLNRTRSTLFSFAGAVRHGFKDDFRGILLNECAAANNSCRALDCGGGRCGNSSVGTLGLFLDSSFCLQPRGDSFTRRSLFDCIVAGAVPVLFWKRSAYVQYKWYVPGIGEEGEWSVFIDRREMRAGNVSVRGVLEGIGDDRLRRMRERVVDMIPRLVYAAAEGMDDAVDIALNGVLRRFAEQRWRRNVG